MTRPAVKIEIDFGDPTSEPNWTDVTNRLLDKGNGGSLVAIDRGRQNELDTVRAGTATVRLDNRDRGLDPSYAAGPYYGSLLPMRRLRVSIGGIPQFTGFIEAFPLRYPSHADSTCEIRATDGFKVLAKGKLYGSYPEEGTGARVERVLDAVGWTTGDTFELDSSLLDGDQFLGPVGDRLVDAGASLCQAQVLDGVGALQHLQEVERVEAGLLFIDRSGVVRFVNRNSAIYGREPMATFGDALDGSELPYLDIIPTFDDADIYNQVTVTRNGGEPHVVPPSTTTSQRRYFVSPMEVSSLPLAHVAGESAAENEAQARAEYLLARYEEPSVRVAELLLNGGAEPTGLLWAAMVEAEIGDVNRVLHRPAGGAAIDVTCQVAGIRWEIGVELIQQRLLFASVDTGDYLMLDSGTLDESLLAY